MASVSSFIHAHGGEIIAEWLDKARPAASARGLSAVALENVMPVYLHSLADRFDTDHSEASDERRKHVLNHLSTRLRQGFELAEIVDEFVLLSRCVANVWFSLPRDQWPSAIELDQLHLQIQSAILDVTDTFHRHMLDDEQSDKRYLRLLQLVASEALHDEKRPLRDRLRDFLELVMEAMDAECAAFLLYDAARAKLELVACAGAEVLESYATSVDPRSFAGEVAQHEEPTTLRDASTTLLDVPDSLRESGVHSLLGVRLPPLNNLLGVMYVGISEAREFLPRELHRIMLLGERIGLHLENARLFAELRDKIAELDVEKGLRERFVSTLAHDLRGPLSAARLAADMLEMRPASLDERRDLAHKIQRNIERVDQMIRDLLDANRIHAGEPLPLRLDSCDLVALAEQVAHEARALHGDRFVVEADEPVRGIWSEQDIHRALWNLVTNAVKYGAPTGPITIGVHRTGDVVRLSVHNIGTPVPPAEQAHLFAPYARARAAVSGGQTGWGLGLTLVRGVAEAHGGRASLTSDLTSGTTFTIELPVDTRRALGISQPPLSQTVH